MNFDVVITCAVTGAGDTVGKNPNVPVTPQQIADSAVEAAKAGAAVAHLHVRDPKTGQTARSMELYEETVDLVKQKDPDVIINITAGMGADLVPDEKDAMKAGPGSDMITAAERVAHIEKIKPDISTLDCGSMNYAATAYVATMDMLRETARRIQAVGVKPEIEVFELGHIWQAKQLVKEGLVDPDPIFQLCMGIPFGTEATVDNLVAMKNALPVGAMFGTFAIGRMQMPWAAQSVLAGGNVRVGLEDNIYLDKGVPATNEQLVERARQVIEKMGARVLNPKEARQKLKLK